MGENFTDPVSPIKEGMIQFHQVFLNLMEGGFSERQALIILTELVIRQIPDA